MDFKSLIATGSGGYLEELDVFYDVNFGGVSDAVAYDDKLYITSSSGDSLTILDISDPTNISRLGFYAGPTLNSVKSIVLSSDKNTAFVVVGPGGSGDNGIVSLDVSNPANITVLDTLFNNTYLYIASSIALSADGNTAFVAAYENDALTAINVSNPNAMSYIDHVVDETKFGGITEISIVGDIAYCACYYPGRLTTVNIATPSNMVILDSEALLSSGRPKFLAVDGTECYTQDYLTTNVVSFNVSNPSTLTVLENYTSMLANNEKMAVDGNLLYITYYTGFVSIIDISNPSNLVDAGEYTSGNIVSPVDITIYNGVGYIPNSTNSTLVSVNLTI